MCPASKSSTGFGMPPFPAASISVALPPMEMPSGPLTAAQIGRCIKAQDRNLPIAERRQFLAIDRHGAGIDRCVRRAGVVHHHQRHCFQRHGIGGV